MVSPLSLQTLDLSCSRDDRLLFEDLNLTVEAGHMLLVEGPNGSGKTSLLRILTGFRLPDEGDVLWSGTPISKLGGDYYEQVSYVGHHDGNKLELNCLENLRLAQAMGAPADIDLDDVLERVNLYAYGETEVGNLSAGQRRRLSLARLIATESKLWILDEPFTSLDRGSISLFEQLFIKQLDAGGMIVMTSHHPLSLADDTVSRLQL